MRKRVSTAPWWIHRDDMNDGGMWAFMHNRKRYVAPAGLLDPPEDPINPDPTVEAMEWHANMMRELEPGWPHRPLVQRRLALSRFAALKLEKLTRMNGGGKSELLRLAIARLLVANQTIPHPPQPAWTEVSFKADDRVARRLSAMCFRQGIPGWWIADFAIRRLMFKRTGNHGCKSYTSH